MSNTHKRESEQDRKKKINEHWKFWKPIVTKKDVSINVTQLKKELSDFSQIMEDVPKVYCAVTGDAISKIMTLPDAVIQVADEHYRKVYLERVKEMIDFLKEEKLISKKANETLKLQMHKFI